MMAAGGGGVQEVVCLVTSMVRKYRDTNTPALNCLSPSHAVQDPSLWRASDTLLQGASSHLTLTYIETPLWIPPEMCFHGDPTCCQVDKEDSPSQMATVKLVTDASLDGGSLRLRHREPWAQATELLTLCQCEGQVGGGMEQA